MEKTVNVQSVWKKSYFKKSRCGCAECTDHQLLTMTLKPERIRTRKAADHFALKPTATMTQAAKPTIETKIRPTDHWPWRTKPRKRKREGGENERPRRR